jgi:phosphoribosylcarboxyaminoimidazole (NCAIR) mutase
MRAARADGISILAGGVGISYDWTGIIAAATILPRLAKG